MGGRHFVESHKRLSHHHIRQVEPLGDGFVVIHQVVVAGGNVEAVPQFAVEPVDVLLESCTILIYVIK